MISEKEVFTFPREELSGPKEARSSAPPDLCPNCSSPRVRWRKRRFYDVILTWLGAGMLTSGMYGQYDDTFCPSAYYYLDPPTVDPSISWETPRRFWKCPDCGRRGEEY